MSFTLNLDDLFVRTFSTVNLGQNHACYHQRRKQCYVERKLNFSLLFGAKGVSGCVKKL